MLHFGEVKNSQSEVSDEQTSENVLGSARLWLQDCYFRFTTAQINILFNSISVLPSLKYIFPILLFHSNEISRQYFCFSKFSVSTLTSRYLSKN